MGVSDRWVRILLGRMERQGDLVVIHGLRGRPSNHKLPDKTKRQALALQRRPEILPIPLLQRSVDVRWGSRTVTAISAGGSQVAGKRPSRTQIALSQLSPRSRAAAIRSNIGSYFRPTREAAAGPVAESNRSAPPVRSSPPPSRSPMRTASPLRGHNWAARRAIRKRLTSRSSATRNSQARE
jgi:hypothetical protein